ncbi:helix-turn-helix domain-containing protein [Actinomycetes bacterium KLBMP 9759]
MGAPKADRRGYGRLDRATIVTVALAIARRDGMAAVTMRAIADELGKAPMALYRHIGDREALLVAMLDVVAGEIEPPPPSPDPRAEIIGLVTAVHHALHRDAWAVMVQVTEGLASPVVLPLIERLFKALRAAGVGPRDANPAAAVIWDYTYGELLRAHQQDPDSFASRMTRESDPEVYPTLAEVRRVRSHDEFFPEGIAIVVDGVLARYAHP